MPRASQRRARKLLRPQTFQNRENLRGEGFVDFDDISVIDPETEFLLGFRNRVNRSEPHASRIATGIGVTSQYTEWFVAELGCLGFAHDQQRYRSIGNL